ncbi:hypothetical protein KZ820_07290 [Sphingomonas sp. RRHST34]|uniref:Lipoprotein n=1 Tax=Sphingomonas citri TaxID=2862499 RepID=A0ABS7BLP5_9SPHN|nr:hypothetical protein [Sphingomonas citri]MBW6530537.1 hypothetical protein [Sphingomonas citri]
MRLHRAAALALGALLSGCAATPWDFPVPTMIGDKQGVSMTGFMKTDSEDEVRRRLTERMRCPHDLEFASLTTRRADNKLGTHILQYQAVMRCANEASSATPPGSLTTS